MSLPIAPLTSQTTSLVTTPAAASPPTAEAKRAAKLKEAAHDFESILVKQLLKASKVGGDESKGGYGDMAVDALADGIERGGGLGLAHSIEQALRGGSR